MEHSAAVDSSEHGASSKSTAGLFLRSSELRVWLDVLLCFLEVKILIGFFSI